MAQEPISFTIDRLRWFRGKGAVLSKLKLQDQEQYCCMGLYALACGLRPQALEDRAVLEEIIDGGDTFPESLERLLGTPELELIYEVNDDVTMKDCDREARLTQLLATHTIHVTFLTHGQP